MFKQWVIVLLSLWLISPVWAENITIEILDVGQGDGILIRSDQGKTMLIDAGVRKNDVMKMLKSRGIQKIDMVVATHAHADHIGGMEAVVRNFKIGLYVDNGLPHTTTTYINLMKAVEDLGIRYRAAKVGQIYRMGSETTFEVFWPGETPLTGTRSDLNSNSVVLKMVHGEDCALFTGDAEEPTEAKMIEEHLGKCKLLKVAHHGGSHSTKPPFLNMVQPKIALISAGMGNRYRHPRTVTLQRLHQVGAKIYRTDLMGTIKVISTGHGFKIIPEHEATGDLLVGGDGMQNQPGDTVLASSGYPVEGDEDDSGKININTASASELQQLPGIGPGKAKKIVEDREANGPFPTIDSITRVKGIGKGTLNKFRDQITVGGGSGAASSSRASSSHSRTSQAPPSNSSGKINVNTASLSELQKLPGIGKGKAARIIEDREARGPFESCEDLTRVKGIGKGTLKKFISMCTTH